MSAHLREGPQTLFGLNTPTLRGRGTPNPTYKGDGPPPASVLLTPWKRGCFLFNLMSRRVNGRAEPRQPWTKEAWAKGGTAPQSKSPGPREPTARSRSPRAAAPPVWGRRPLRPSVRPANADASDQVGTNGSADPHPQTPQPPARVLGEPLWSLCRLSPLPTAKPRPPALSESHGATSLWFAQKSPPPRFARTRSPLPAGWRWPSG